MSRVIPRTRTQDWGLALSFRGQVYSERSSSTRARVEARLFYALVGCGLGLVHATSITASARNFLEECRDHNGRAPGLDAGGFRLSKNRLPHSVGPNTMKPKSAAAEDEAVNRRLSVQQTQRRKLCRPVHKFHRGRYWGLGWRVQDIKLQHKSRHCRWPSCSFFSPPPSLGARVKIHLIPGPGASTRQA
jgi:hypothetical protein